MIYPFDFHTHSTYCDGENSPLQMVESAVKNGLKAIGFSGHSYTDFDKSYCMSEENTQKYIAEINTLRKRFDGKIKIFCGIEKDFYSTVDTLPFDYCIGSVHYCKVGEKYLDVDLSKASFLSCVNEFYGGNPYRFCDDYYENVSQLKFVTDCDIIGHFDLITKFNQDGAIFDETDKKYRSAAFSALDNLLKDDVIFEVNTGAVARGYRKEPYPSRFILERIFEKKGRLLLSGDSHSAKTLCFDFDNALKTVKSVGFNSLWYLTENGFCEMKI